MGRDAMVEGFPDLFGTKKVNGRDVNVEETIAALTRELEPEIAAVLNARRRLLESSAPVREKYAWPRWDDAYEDQVSGKAWTFRQIVQGLIDNFLGRESPWRWRLNGEVAVLAHADPLKNPGLELTGPWHPLDMAFNALNSPAPMNMPDFEDASPPHFRPDGSPVSEPLGIFAALRNAKEIFEGRWSDRPYEVTKKGKRRAYRIAKPPSQWPTRFARPPGLHVRFDAMTVDGRPVPGIVPVATLWILNNYDALTRAGSGAYFYIPKLQSPREALIVEKLLSRLEGVIGVPAGTFKIKMLYEEGNAGRYLPAIAWVLRRRLLGMNVGRWDYLGSLIEMWKDDPKGVFPDPQSVGMAMPNMIAYQRHNALTMLMAGGAPIGGMAAVMIYQPSDTYGRSRYNPLALRAVAMDKLRERLLGLVFVPDETAPSGSATTLDDILAHRVKGRLHDLYRQSWVASPEPEYVGAGNVPLQAPVERLQALVDAQAGTVDVRGKAVPTVASGLTAEERKLFESRGLLDGKGRIAPILLYRGEFDAPEKLLGERWNAIYGVPKGDVTIEHIQHAFYMAANYGFQILYGNFAAAIDDYELKQRFMNDLATYRIYVSWLWTLAHHQAPITKDGHLLRATITEDGVVLGAKAAEVKAGTPFTRDLFQKVWEYHDAWTSQFFAEQDRRKEAGRFDRSKAPVIMELLKRQFLSPRYIQHSARVLFLVGEAKPADRGALFEAIFDLPREEIVERVRRGALDQRMLAAHDYVYDVVEGL